MNSDSFLNLEMMNYFFEKLKLIMGDATAGSQWYSGTGITGTSTSPQIFSNSGVTEAKTNDMYLNTYYGNVYTCVTGGAASTATWKYISNLKGPQGPRGYDGDDGSDGPRGQKGNSFFLVTGIFYDSSSNYYYDLQGVEDLYCYENDTCLDISTGKFYRCYDGGDANDNTVYSHLSRWTYVDELSLSDFSGTLPISKGGTGQTSQRNAMAALNKAVTLSYSDLDTLKDNIVFRGVGGSSDPFPYTSVDFVGVNVYGQNENGEAWDWFQIACFGATTLRHLMYRHKDDNTTGWSDWRSIAAYEDLPLNNGTITTASGSTGNAITGLRFTSTANATTGIPDNQLEKTLGYFINSVTAAPADAGSGPITSLTIGSGANANTLYYRRTSGYLSGTVSVSNGGTGKESLTKNYILAGNGTSAVQLISNGNGAFYCTGSGNSYTPQFGTLPIAQGGTEATTASAARSNLGLSYCSSISSSDYGVALASNVFEACLGAGEEIPKNSNLDDYKTAGIFRVANATNAASITNSPITNAGYALRIRYCQTAGYVRQEAYTGTGPGSWYIRHYKGSSAGWTGWFKFTGTAI